MPSSLIRCAFSGLQSKHWLWESSPPVPPGILLCCSQMTCPESSSCLPFFGRWHSADGPQTGSRRKWRRAVKCWVIPSVCLHSSVLKRELFFPLWKPGAWFVIYSLVWMGFWISQRFFFLPLNFRHVCFVWRADFDRLYLRTDAGSCWVFCFAIRAGRRFPKRGGTSSVLVLNPAAECRLRCVGQFVLKWTLYVLMMF